MSGSYQFSKELTNRVIAYSIDRARQLWGDNTITSVSIVYKSHLVDGVFGTWAEDWSEEYDIKIKFVQPATAYKDLLAYGIRGRELIIAGNEWADTMHVILLNIFGLDAQQTRCTENVYLHPDVYGLSEYQNVHSSTDDITIKGLGSPAATVRAAALILERHAGCKGIEAAMELALSSLRRRNMVTPDHEGSTSPTEVVDRILDTMTAACLAPSYLGL